MRTLVLIAFLAPVLSCQATLPRAIDIPARYLRTPAPESLPTHLVHPLAEPDSARVFELGRRLFFDPLLSIDHTVSCASCHDPAHGFASSEPLPPGVLGRRATRNAPTLLNRVLGRRNSWDGRARDLEEQVLLPIFNELEMALPLEDALGRLCDDSEYPDLFEAALGSRIITTPRLARALATFVRGLRIGDSPVDRFRAGDAAALTSEERRGLWIYESKGSCWRCHSGPNVTDEDFHATGIGAIDGRAEEGRMAVTALKADHGRFKTPTLRGLPLTAPYMHDGSLATLEQVVAFYRRGGEQHGNQDPLIRPLDLDDAEAAALVAFLRALGADGAERGQPDPGER